MEEEGGEERGTFSPEAVVGEVELLEVLEGALCWWVGGWVGG